MGIVSNFISYKNSRIHFLTIGSGRNFIVCFHGFGESADSFAILEDYCNDQFCLVAFDLPLHGKTEWREKEDFTVETLMEIVNQISSLQHSNFAIAGYSLGGRIALSLYQAVPGRATQLILIAPDGLKMNFWYWLATQNSLGNNLFKYTMHHPAWFIGVTRFLKKIRVVNESVYKFSYQYLKNRDSRLQVYHIWTALRLFKPRLNLIKKDIARNQTQVKIIYGKYDRVIRYERGEKFRKEFPPFCSIDVLNSGHQVLNARNAAEIASIINRQFDLNLQE